MSDQGDDENMSYDTQPAILFSSRSCDPTLEDCGEHRNDFDSGRAPRSTANVRAKDLIVGGDDGFLVLPLSSLCVCRGVATATVQQELQGGRWLA